MLEFKFALILALTDIILIVTRNSQAYNINTDNPIILRPGTVRGGRPMYFGHSLAILEDGANTWLLVGAPRDNSSVSSVNEVGSLYSCLLRGNTECELVTVDTSGNGPATGGYSNKRDESWLGGTVEVFGSGPQAQVLTCASRWSNDVRSQFSYRMNGACYYGYVQEMRSGPHFTRPMQMIIPLFDYSKQAVINANGQYVYHYQYGQAGFSSAISKKTGEIILGSPGLNQWAGGVIKMTEAFTAINSQALLLPEVHFGSRHVESYDLLGYSVAVGEFTNSGQELIAAAAPRAAFFGKVLLLDPRSRDQELSVVQSLVGQQQFSGFGWSLLAEDCNGDGIHELYVGAPLSRLNVDNQLRTDDGSVLVYSSDRILRLLQHKTTLLPPSTGGRFGTSLASIGDIDNDGYNDMAVGAPVEDRGVVYIYRGGPHGISSTYSQRITAQEVSSELTGFGGAISAGVDLRGTGYNGIVVGSSMSDAAVLLEALPVVQAGVILMVEPTILNSPAQLFNVTACVGYTVTHGQQTGYKRAYLKVILDSRSSNTPGRALFLPSLQQMESFTLSVRNGQQFCKKIQARLQDKITDISQSLYVEAVVSSDKVQETVGSSATCPSCPVLTPSSVMEALQELTVAPGCGSDHYCTPQLTLAGRFTGVNSEGSYVLGSDEHLTLEVTVAAELEWAYQALFTVTLPESVTVRSVPVVCSVLMQPNLTVTCKLPSPLTPGEEAMTAIVLQVSAQQKYSTVLTVPIVAMAQEVQVQEEMPLPLKRDVSISLTGATEPEQLQIGSTSESQVRFHFAVQNDGTTQSASSTLQIWLPMQLDNHTVLSNVSFIVDDTSTMCRLKDAKQQKDTEGAPPPVEPQYGVIQCEPEHLSCWQVSCTVNGLGTEAVTVVGDLNVGAIEALHDNKSVNVIAIARASWAADKIEGFTEEVEAAASILVTTRDRQPVLKELPWWVMALAVTAGLVLLAIIIIVFYMCGFFKRKRPPVKEVSEDTEEMIPQTMNTSECTERADDEFNYEAATDAV